MFGGGDGDHAVIFHQAHHLDALGGSGAQANRRRGDANQDAGLGNQHQILLGVDGDNGRHVAVTLDVIIQQALAAAFLQAVVVVFADAAEAGFADGEGLALGRHNEHADDLVIFPEAHGAHAGGGTAERAGVGLVEANGLALFGGDQQVVFAGGQFDADEFVILTQRQGDNAVAAGVGVGLQRRAFEDAALGHHAQVVEAALFGDANHSREFFTGLNRQNVHDVRALAVLAAFGNLVPLQLIGAGAGGEEHNLVVRRGDEHRFGNVVLAPRHPLDAAAALVLHGEAVDGLALDIAHSRIGIQTVLFGNQVLDVDFAADVFDGGAALVGVFVADGVQLGLDDAEHALVRSEDIFILGDAAVDIIQLVANLLNLQTGELAETERHDGGGLRIVEVEFVHNGLLRFRLTALAGADGGDDVVDNVDGAGKTF